jgi:hypothetical protein
MHEQNWSGGGDTMSTRHSKDLSNSDLDSSRELLTWQRRTSVYFLDRFLIGEERNCCEMRSNQVFTDLDRAEKNRRISIIEE